VGRQATREEYGEEVIRSEDGCNADGDIYSYLMPSRDDKAEIENAKRDLEYDHSSCVQRKGDQDVLKSSLAACSCRRYNRLVPIWIEGNAEETMMAD
jgi:hypothetical protein